MKANRRARRSQLQPLTRPPTLVIIDDPYPTALTSGVDVVEIHVLPPSEVDAQFGALLTRCMERLQRDSFLPVESVNTRSHTEIHSVGGPPGAASLLSDTRLHDDRRSHIPCHR